MRIPWFVVVLAVLLVTALTWHLRTREMDFLTPARVALPPEDFATELSAFLPKAPEPKKETPLIAEPKKAPLPELAAEDLGDLASSPALSEYQRFAQERPVRDLLHLSQTLKVKGAIQRAFLALERVIDSTAADPSDVETAGAAITDLRPDLLPWNFDPQERSALTLHLETNLESSPALREAALNLATLIESSSGSLIKVTPKITSSQPAETPSETPEASEILTISFFKTDQPESASEKIRLAVSANGSEFTDQLDAAITQFLRQKFLRISTSHPLESEQLRMTTHLTRLMWQNFDQSLSQPKSATAPQTSSDSN